MFESRFQTAQFFLAIAFLFAIVGMCCLLARSYLLGITCLVLEHAAAAAGCSFYAAAKGYPYLIGIPLGVGLGVMGSVLILIMPDENHESEFEVQRRLASEGIRNARKRDPGYEVLDDDDD